MKNRFLQFCIAILVVLFFGCSTSSDGNGNSTTILILPSISNNSVSVTSNSASTGGTITSDGGAPIIARGVVWSTSPTPTVALPTKTTDGTGIGAFTSTATGLYPNTEYNLRVYATNSLGTAYGTEISITTSQDFNAINVPGPNVTDIDGNVYQSVTNCGLTFTKQNLNVSKYSDGTPIPQVTDPSQWANLTKGAWCYIVNETLYGTTFGKLYNWYAVVGVYDAASATNPALRKKLAPTDWHVPSDGEWSSLINCLDPNADGGNIFPNAAGGKLKSTGSIQTQSGYWQSPNTDATNASGFEGRPGGGRNIYGAFNAIYNTGGWWSSSELNATVAWYRDLYYSNGYVSRLSEGKNYGFSVRCLRD